MVEAYDAVSLRVNRRPPAAEADAPLSKIGKKRPMVTLVASSGWRTPASGR
jgi:hypothetical protein